MDQNNAPAGIEAHLRSLDAAQSHAVNEFATRSIINKVVKSGDITLDLGANEGFHTFNLADRVGRTGLVHAFEPNPAHWRNLLTRDNVRLWPVAVGEAVSVENFYLPEEASLHQVGSLVDPRDFLGAIEMRTLSVPQVSIDELKEIDAGRITFVKMDIERREIFCMRGMRSILTGSAPVLVFENLTAEIEDFLQSVGYSVHSLGLGVPMELFPNVIAIPIGRIAELHHISLGAAELMDVVAAATA